MRATLTLVLQNDDPDNWVIHDNDDAVGDVVIDAMLKDASIQKLSDTYSIKNSRVEIDVNVHSAVHAQTTLNARYQSEQITTIKNNTYKFESITITPTRESREFNVIQRKYFNEETIREIDNGLDCKNWKLSDDLSARLEILNFTGSRPLINSDFPYTYRVEVHEPLAQRQQLTITVLGDGERTLTCNSNLMLPRIQSFTYNAAQ